MVSPSLDHNYVAFLDVVATLTVTANPVGLTFSKHTIMFIACQGEFL